MDLKKYQIWLEEAISKKFINYFEYKQFNNIHEIGKGGFGKVYKATWKNLELTVALKKITIVNLDDNVFKGFINELKLLQKISFHPNIIRIYSVTKDPSNECYKMVLQFANNGNLHEYLKYYFSKLKCADKLRIAREIAFGLEFLHKHKIVHRNLEAENILVHDGKIKISVYSPMNSLDNIHKYSGDNNDNEKYRVLPYVAPEVLLTKKYICEANIYSFGILFYEIMLGASPYHNFTFIDDLEIRICNGLRPEFPKHAPKLFEQLMTQCWNAVPSQRPRAVELKDILNRWHSDVYNDLQAEINDQCKKYEDYLMSNLLKKKIRPDKLTVREVKKIKDDPLIKYKFIPPQNSMEDHIIVFEYADSRTLRSYFHNNFSEFSWDDKIKFARQIADAICYLHKGAIHRDLHSGNILIHRSNIKIADFGLSKRLEATNSNSNLHGAIAYIDPQCFKSTTLKNENFKFNKKSDIYSIGVFMWELFNGYPPFRNKGQIQIGALILDIDKGTLENEIERTSSAYIKLNKDCWRNNPDSRRSIQKIVLDFKVLINNNDQNKTSTSQKLETSQILNLINQKINEYKELLSALNKSLKINPNNKFALKNREVAYQNLGRYEESLEDLNSLLEIDPNNAGALMNRGQTYHIMCRYEELLTDLKKSLEIEPNNILALIARGTAYSVIGRYEKSIADFTKCLEIDPDNGPVLGYRRKIYGMMSKYEESFENLNKSLGINPNDATALNDHGIAYKEMNKCIESLVDLNKSLEIRQNDAMTLNSCGLTYQKMGRYEESFIGLSKSLEIRPNNAVILSNRGLTYQKTGKDKESTEKALAEALCKNTTLTNLNLQLNNLSESAGKALAEALCKNTTLTNLNLQSNNLGESLIDLNKSLEIRSYDATTLNNRELTYQNMGRYEESLADFNISLELNPIDDTALSNHGLILLDMDRYEDSLADLSKSLDIGPNYDIALLNHGATYRYLGRYDKSLSYFNKSLETNPNVITILNNRGLTYQYMSRYEESVVDFNKSLEISSNFASELNNRAVTFQYMCRYKKSLANSNKYLELKSNDADTLNNRGLAYQDMGRCEESLADIFTKLSYIIIFIALFRLVYFFVNCQNVPSPRREQASTLVDTKLDFFGGATSLIQSNDVWYLDLSSSFNISTPPWHSDVAMPVGYNLGNSCLSPIDNSTVFLVEKRSWIITSTITDYYLYASPIYKFNSKTSQWTIPSINNFNSSFTTRNEMQAVIDNNGNIFIFGGVNYDYSTSAPTIVYNDMNILDNGSGSNISLINMAQVQIFDTKTYTWSIKFASGSIITSRLFHSAVLTQDGNIIIYGGSTPDTSGAIANVFFDIAVLNTNSWVWSVPSISGPNAPPLTQHSAALYKNYIIIALGAASADNIYILNTQNYSWVTTFTNLDKLTRNIPTRQKKYDFSGLYAGILLVICAIVLVIVFFVRFLIHENRHKKITNNG